MGRSKTFISTLATNGQVVIPKELREAMGLKGGDTVVFLAEEEKAGFLKVSVRRPAPLFASMVGALKHLAGRPYREILYQLDGEEPR